MILCSRCGFVAFPGDCSKAGPIAALLEHWDAVHGGWSVRRVLHPRLDESNVVTFWRVAVQ